eukprot:TRINITY_DN63721_c0_g1_i1.p1 TRINITY_DN63721_c0_g1~~TRINITY_DN63721_c0_g1_i1.p1  ORF type:complete len:503 (-),score=89.73 TRINITY_DN63721_c0_g1_i1:193-1701(-)
MSALRHFSSSWCHPMPTPVLEVPNPSADDYSCCNSSNDNSNLPVPSRRRRCRSVLVVGMLAIALLSSTTSYVESLGWLVSHRRKPIVRSPCFKASNTEASLVGFQNRFGQLLSNVKGCDARSFPTSQTAVAESSSDSAPNMSWKGDVRTLLLSRNREAQRAALDRIQPIFEKQSAEIFAEFASHGATIAKGSWRDRLRFRPVFGYRSACASVYRTVVEYVMPEQAGSSVQVRKRGEDGTKGVRYALKDDVMDGSGDTKTPKEAAGEESSEPGNMLTSKSDTAQQARALFVVLRQLPGSSPWSVESVAARAKEEDQGGSSDKWSERTPDLETPDYEVIRRDPTGLFEIRRYDAYSVVQTKMGGNGTNSFFSLAGYIFGKTNEKQQKMAMTTPVQTVPSQGTMSFIMPKEYWGEGALQAAPAPMANASVELIPRPEEIMAVTVFGGYARSKAVEEKTQALLAAVDAAEGLEVLDRNAIRLMQYNDPFTVPWKRRNEVAVPVRAA